jgi:hypothetical protein
VGMYLDKNSGSPRRPGPDWLDGSKGIPKTVAIFWSAAYALLFVGICFHWFYGSYASFS